MEKATAILETTVVDNKKYVLISDLVIFLFKYGHNLNRSSLANELHRLGKTR